MYQLLFAAILIQFAVVVRPKYNIWNENQELSFILFMFFLWYFVLTSKTFIQNISISKSTEDDTNELHDKTQNETKEMHVIESSSHDVMSVQITNILMLIFFIFLIFQENGNKSLFVCAMCLVPSTAGLLFVLEMHRKSLFDLMKGEESATVETADKLKTNDV